MSLGDRFRRWLESGERVGFRLAAKALFVAVLVLLGIISFSANVWLVALLAGLVVAMMLRAVLPTGRFQDYARSYWTGEAGDRWRRRFEAVASRIRGWLPG